MSTTALVIIVILAVIAAIALGALGAMLNAQRRQRDLKAQFGPEYERTVGSTGDPKRAELDLRDRVARRKKLQMRPLPPSERARYSQEWRQAQATFVEQPEVAVEQADALITSAMAQRGYPMEAFDEQADLLSVDYPDIVENYRRAHDICMAARRAPAPTEDLRKAFVSYRALFVALVDSGNSDQEAGVARAQGPEVASPGAPPAPRPAR
jgi:hypothetical protein